MINSIIEFSGRNKFVIFLIVAAAVAAGLWSMKNVALDAIPDLSDTQVIVYSRWDRSPDIMEDQVTYPISSAMLSVPGVRTVRGFSIHTYFKKNNIPRSSLLIVMNPFRAFHRHAIDRLFFRGLRITGMRFHGFMRRPDRTLGRVQITIA